MPVWTSRGFVFPNNSEMCTVFLQHYSYAPIYKLDGRM